MAPNHLHVIAIEPGEVTSWVRLTVPRESVYENQPGSFLDMDSGSWKGTEEQMAMAICRHARGVQSLDYPVGPALVIRNSSGRADELDAMLRFALYRGDLGKEIQQAIMMPAQHTVTDQELMALDLYDEYGANYRDAMRTALAFLRLAKADHLLRDAAWAKVIG